MFIYLLNYRLKVKLKAIVMRCLVYNRKLLYCVAPFCISGKGKVYVGIFEV